MFDFLSFLKPQNRLVQPAQADANMLTQPQSPGLFDRIRDFQQTDRGQAIGDMFAGWAQGSTPQESLAMGGRMMAAGKEKRGETAGNVSFLMKGGYDEQSARALAKSGGPALTAAIKSIIDARDPNNALDSEYKRAQISNIESQIKERNDPNARNRFGNEIIWGQNEKGEWVPFQSSTGGGITPADVPPGIRLAPPGIGQVDLGTSFGIRDRAGNIISTIAKDVAGEAAEKASGKALGEDTATYQSMMSKMPGLEKVVSDLGVLAGKATYTAAGRARDTTQRELGMDPGEGAIARAQYIAMVDNQVLPMLRDTFGAQFTVAEGESLRATLGDPNKSPKEKEAILRSFIEQKRRDIEALGARVGAGATDFKSKYGLD